jgi:hypothetical protein
VCVVSKCLLLALACNCKGKICFLQANENIGQIETVQFYNFDDYVLEINGQIIIVSSFKKCLAIYFLRNEDTR